MNNFFEILATYFTTKKGDTITPTYSKPRLRKRLTRHEGKRLKPYQDSVGIWTWGIGHNLQANG